MLIGDWIDNVFGYNQLPEEDDRTGRSEDQS